MARWVAWGPGLARTLVLYGVAALLLATGWLRLEEGAAPAGAAFALGLLAAAPLLVRPPWARALAAAFAALVAARLAFGHSLLDARPRDPERDFLGPLVSDFGHGVLAFFDVGQPFSPVDHPQMHGVVLMAVFGFSLLVALALAARRPLLAGLAVAVGVGWPLTLVPSGNDLLRGAILLGLVLALLALAGKRPQRAPRHATALGLVLVVAASAATTSPAVAKTEFIQWKAWSPYSIPQDPVGVGYVWDSSYDGIEFPEEKTTVLTVTGPQRPLYWRATTLDSFADDRWFESLYTTRIAQGPVDLLSDGLLPARARDPQQWVRAEVTIEALRDTHLPAPSTPVRYEPGRDGEIQYGPGGVAWVEDGVQQGERYRVRSFAPRPTPEQLARGRLRPHLAKTTVSRYLELGSVAMPPFGVAERDAAMARLLEDADGPEEAVRNRQLLERARVIVGRPATPYAAVVAIESWLRAEGGFAYEEQPPPVPPGVSPLVHFVETTRAGYCQHYAGAMAVMLRYLGIPARVAVGFTSGTYDSGERQWVVTDHNAHAWVEVWFENWGWVPFDPTPSRGQLSGTYTAASTQFDSSAAARLIGEGRGGVPSGAGLDLGGRLAEQRLGDGDGNPFRGGPTGFGVGPAPAPVSVEERGASLLRLLALLAVAVAAAIVLAKVVRRAARHATRDPRRRAAALRREVVDFLLDQGVQVPRSATLEELGRMLERELGVEASGFVRSASAARFAAPERAPSALARARRELRLVRKRLRMRVGVGSRMRGAISLRSLGV